MRYGDNLQENLSDFFFFFAIALNKTSPTQPSSPLDKPSHKALFIVDHSEQKLQQQKEVRSTTIFLSLQC